MNMELLCLPCVGTDFITAAYTWTGCANCLAAKKNFADLFFKLAAELQGDL